MSKKINCIMLIDDNEDDNFFHERTIRKSGIADKIQVENSAADALAFLKAKAEHKELHPDLIFLDINMPSMNGWEFLEEYEKLPMDIQSKVIIVMLTTSNDFYEKEKAMSYSIVADFRTKPLTIEALKEITEKFF